MPFNKLSYSGQNTLSPPMTIALTGGQSFLLPPGQGVIGTFGAVAPQITGFTLSGQYYVNLGPYTVLQYYDSNLQCFRNAPLVSGRPTVISSDGTNFQLTNSTGAAVGALITNTGSGLTNGFNTVAVTSSANGSTWNTIVGGSINTTVTITAAGASYTVPPNIVFNPPASQGATPYILPTGYVTLTSGAITGVTITNGGAGLVAAPTIQVINSPNDTTGNGGVLTVNATLINSGKLTALYPTYCGTNGTGVHTFTFSPASTIAATMIMNFTVSGITVVAGGAGYGNAQPFAIITAGAQIGGAAAAGLLNPAFDINLVFPRNASIQGTSTAGGAVTGTGLVIADAGYGFQAVPNLFPIAGGSGLATTQAQVTATVSGANDVCVIQSI